MVRKYIFLIYIPSRASASLAFVSHQFIALDQPFLQDLVIVLRYNGS